MNIKETVYKIIADKLDIADKSKITDNSKFSDLGADSLDTVEFVMQLESEFNISIPDEEASKMETVGDAIRYIEAHVKGAKVVEMKPAGDMKAAA